MTKFNGESMVCLICETKWDPCDGHKHCIVCQEQEELRAKEKENRRFYACTCYMEDPGVECDACKKIRVL